MYAWRSLKRGYTSEDLGISEFKAKSIMMKEEINNFKTSLNNEHLGKTFDDKYESIKNKFGSFF